jgi:hypothetical protein
MHWLIIVGADQFHVEVDYVDIRRVLGSACDVDVILHLASMLLKKGRRGPLPHGHGSVSTI